MFKRIVNVIEILVLIGTAVFAILLFANEPTSGGSASSYAPPGASLFVANCASCHGIDGSGGSGPALSAGKLAAAYPNATDEVQVVANGRNAMPGFGHRLSPADIDLVVDYTRTL